MLNGTAKPDNIFYGESGMTIYCCGLLFADNGFFLSLPFVLFNFIFFIFFFIFFKERSFLSKFGGSCHFGSEGHRNEKWKNFLHNVII